MNGKTVVVTGSGSGIGQACATLFAKQGANVVVSDVDDEAGQSVVKAITDAGGSAAYQHCDVAEPEAVDALVKFAVETFGGLHTMVNNAGIGGEQAPTADYPIEAWRRVIDINLNGVFYGTKYAIPAIIESGGGAVVNIASILGSVGFAGAPAYVAAKHGVVGLTKNAAMEYAQQGVRVNAVGPAFIRTPLIESVTEDEDMTKMLVGLHPIGRLGDPDEVAELVVWLCSDKASFCTGAYYPVDGAYLAR